IRLVRLAGGCTGPGTWRAGVPMGCWISWVVRIRRSSCAASGSSLARSKVREDGAGGKRLVGYVVAAGGQAAPDPSALRAALSRQLPDHMVPSAVVVL